MPRSAFQVVRIHDAFNEGFVGAENPALPQHGVHQGGLAVVHVRDDGDVSIFWTHIPAYRGRFAAKSSKDKNSC